VSFVEMKKMVRRLLGEREAEMLRDLSIDGMTESQRRYRRAVIYDMVMIGPCCNCLWCSLKNHGFFEEGDGDM
jgi:hypothetical protein